MAQNIFSWPAARGSNSPRCVSEFPYIGDVSTSVPPANSASSTSTSAARCSAPETLLNTREVPSPTGASSSPLEGMRCMRVSAAPIAGRPSATPAAPAPSNASRLEIPDLMPYPFVLTTA